MKIITIAETECGGKPTIYAAEIANTNFDTLLDHMKKGLPKQEILDEDVDALKEQGYTWIAERYCVEVTEIGEGTDTKEESTAPKHNIVQYSPFKRLKVTADVDWDIGPDDYDYPDRSFSVIFVSSYLEAIGVITEKEEDPTVWDFDETAFKEWFGEYLTSFTDFLHNGFTYTVQPINK
jgi:hypothetical protein